MTCPFIDEDHAKCEQILRISQLPVVMNVCLDHFEKCSIYQERVGRRQDSEQPQLKLRRCA